MNRHNMGFARGDMREFPCQYAMYNHRANKLEDNTKCESQANSLPAMVFIEVQPPICSDDMYDESTALSRGTLFKSLDKPFIGCKGGCNCGRM